VDRLGESLHPCRRGRVGTTTHRPLGVCVCVARAEPKDQTAIGQDVEGRGVTGQPLLGVVSIQRTT
jgi:hypothetical protein